MLVKQASKQSIPLTLAIFNFTNISAISQYFPEEKNNTLFLNILLKWWLIVDTKERIHPTIVGNALVANNGK